MNSVQMASLAGLLAIGLSAEPIKLHPENPHYYLFRGQPTILITSAEHYGGVVNKDFDYVTYFDALKSYGLNYTRIYPGYLFEPMGKFMKGNTLAPSPSTLPCHGPGARNRDTRSGGICLIWTNGTPSFSGA
jgi:hypothetical protein